MTSKDLPQLIVNARAPFHVYYEGPARRVSARNKVGIFDILPEHADFFSMLVPGEISIETDTDTVTFTIQNGIAAVHDNLVTLFINI